MNHQAQQSRRRARESRGQSMVEFAVAIPGLMLVAIAIANFAMVIFAYNFVCYSARDATRYAAVRGATSASPVSAGDVASYVSSEATGLNSSQLTVATTWSPDNEPSSLVNVQVQYNFRFLVPFVQLSPVSLSSSSQLAISQ